MRTLTNSSMNTAKTCLRKYELAYVHGLRRAEDQLPLKIGSIVHDALDLRAKGENWVAYLDKAMATEFTEDAESQAMAHMTRSMVLAYDWRWKDNDAHLRVIDSEMPFDVPILNPETSGQSKTFRYSGKIDKIVEFEGRCMIMEHKTTAGKLEPGCDYLKRLTIDSQVTLYWLAALDLGYEVEGVLYDVITKPSIRPKALTQKDAADFAVSQTYFGDNYEVVVRGATYSHEAGKWLVPVGGQIQDITVNGEPVVWEPGAKPGTFTIHETPAMYGSRVYRTMTDDYQRYFHRLTVPRLECDLAETRKELWLTAGLLRDCERDNVFPRNTSACLGFGVCPYFSVCSGGGWTPDDMVPDGYHVLSDVHPELQETQIA